MKLRLGIMLGICLELCARPLFGFPDAPAPPGKSGAAEALYLQLSNTPLDPARVYQVRDASLDRAAIHITLEDGTIAFTQDVLGRITGAFFEGEGDVLLMPPNEVERKSIGLFTGMAILEERFTSAYFRFNDDTANDLKSGLRAANNADDFIRQWGDTARTLSQADALRLLVSFSKMLPVEGRSADAGAAEVKDPRDRMLHARLQGVKLGVFDIHFDLKAAEQIQAGQARAAQNGLVYYDIWTSFSVNPPWAGPSGQARARSGESLNTAREEGEPLEEFAVHRYEIEAEVRPPKQLNVEARLQVDITRDGARALVFELSRFLQLQAVEANGQPVEFIHNPAVEGTQISRRGNDLVVVILPAPAQSAQKLEVRFVYGGEVLAEAGNGLLYVGARGNWYPNRGMAMADFDLKFRYPRGWTLLATGKPMATSMQLGDGPPPGPTSNLPDEQTSRWISERPLPVAGFNLGRYIRATAQAGNVTVESYAAPGVEREFPKAPVRVIEPDPALSPDLKRPQQLIVPIPPSPARNALHVAQATAQALQYYSRRFGPFPYSHLALTQMPGPESQGWPGLVFLSSYAFLSEQERADLHMDSSRSILAQQVPAHETAHQWWGDLITWKSYRDQWISEGLANYCSLMMLQEKNPEAFHQIMERYRQALVENKNGELPKDAGPVTLGARLLSSHAPEGYEAISYGRGTWLFHMLRSMLLDVATERPSKTEHGHNSAEEPFVLALRKLRQRFEGKAISTSELLEIFAEGLPPSLRYEGKASLDWFLQGWINGTALPKLQLQSVKFTPKGNVSIVSGTVLQKDASEDLVTSVPLYAVVSGKASVFIGRVFADGTESSFHLSAPAGTHKILLDPKQTILTAPK
jgi:peptidase M1-like protein